MNSSRLRIVIVEDEAAHAAAIRRAFEEAGVEGEITVAGTLKEYRATVANEVPDIAVMDLNLPDGRAVEVLRWPPEDGPFPILIMTSYGNEQVAVEALKSGALDYVVKSPEAFIAMPKTVTRVLREWNLLQERKRAEEELRESNRELETFNYTVAHDLRKPLTVINGYCQTLRELCGDKLDEECKQYLHEAYEGTLRMNRLIDALLEFSRLGHAEPKREEVDISAIAAETAAELKLAEPERRVVFTVASGMIVEGDAGLLRVVVANLLGNAWKYTADREEGVIEVGMAESEGKRVCFVRDNGVGFDMSDARTLFIPFKRLPSATEKGGLGIGLATVERIIKRHGGAIWAEGETGKGATFYFHL